MKNKRIVKIIIVTIITIAFAVTFGKTYSKYVLTRHFETTFSSLPFYFTTETIDKTAVFPRTEDKNDYEQILTEETTFRIKVSNNDGSNYNSFDTKYEISMVENDKFTFKEGDKVTKTISGNTLKNDTISLNLKIKNMESPLKSFKIKVKSISPYAKEEILTINVEQEGAIQTIEDLVDLSLASRNIKTDKFTQNEALTDRFKMTRDLDFQVASSYENSTRVDYNNVNSDSHTDNLITEMTANAGFLPIGSHSSNYRFKGVFNGGKHTLKNLLIHSANSANSGSVGLFEDTEGATIRDLIIRGEVTTTKFANMGSLIGRAFGSLTIENVENYASVKNESGLNGGTGGIVGSINDNVGEVIFKNVKNYGNVQSGNQAGGIVAWVQGSITIDDCRNYGNVTLDIADGLDGLRVGGLVGCITIVENMDIIIKESSNHGTVIGKHNSGGIIGLQNAGTDNNANNNYIIVNSYNAGSVTGENVGGIVGYSVGNGNIIVVNSANIGRIISNANSYACGIIGYSSGVSEHITIKNVYNSGVLEGKTMYGIGYFNTSAANVTIEHSYRAKDHLESNLNSALGNYDYEAMKTQEFADLMNEFVIKNNNAYDAYKLSEWEIWESEYPTLKLDDYNEYLRFRNEYMQSRNQEEKQ